MLRDSPFFHRRPQCPEGIHGAPSGCLELFVVGFLSNEMEVFLTLHLMSPIAIYVFVCGHVPFHLCVCVTALPFV